MKESFETYYRALQHRLSLCAHKLGTTDYGKINSIVEKMNNRYQALDNEYRKEISVTGAAPVVPRMDYEYVKNERDEAIAVAEYYIDQCEAERVRADVCRADSKFYGVIAARYARELEALMNEANCPSCCYSEVFAVRDEFGNRIKVIT
jgi:hypothetical protein